MAEESPSSGERHAVVLPTREHVVLDPALCVVACAEGGLDRLGVERRALLGRPLLEALSRHADASLPVDLLAGLSGSLAELRSTRQAQITDVFELIAHADAAPVRIQLACSPLFGIDGELRFIVLYVDDGPFGEVRAGLMAPRQTGAERSLLEAQTALESRVRERTAELERANEELLRAIAEQLKTEQALQRSQEQLHHAQRLEAVGRLAGGIAHDFNNLLSVVLGYSITVAAELPEGSSLRADVEEIRRAGERAAELTQQLLAFGRQQVLEPKVLDLNEILLRVDRMIRRIVGEDIELITVPRNGLWKVKVDPGQIEQVLINLVINARDAMPEGGTLTLETANVDFDAEYAQAHFGAVAGPHVMLAVSDTGVGMDKDTQARVFEPFFTTKTKGKGTGLGLSTVFGIVRQSGGHVWLYSELGKGTMFKVCFPRTGDLEDRTQSAIPRRGSAAPRGNETILLVEDDTQLRALARTILVRQGYQVLDAPNAVEALTMSARFSGEIALLVTDVVMPLMSGRELARQLAQGRPETKVLYMSGYTDNAIVHNGILDPGVSFLQKPITPDVFARKVREVLDAANTGH